MKKTLLIIGMLALGFSAAKAQDPGTTVGNTGSVTFTYNNQSVTLTSVRAADGNIWLQQNLGSSQVATSLTDVNSYGDLFQWGRWDDGHQFRTSGNQQVPTLSNNTPAGIAPGNANFLRNNVQPIWWGGSATTTPAGSPQITDTWAAGAPTATNGTDPCSALGAGWRMPTNAEWVALRTAENMTDLATGFSSNLKLPAGGYRNGANGGLQQPGYASLYWSSTNFSEGNPYSMYNAGATISTGWNRGFGATCRCIKEVMPACSGAPNGGNVQSSLTDICPGSGLSLALANMTIGTDITYQWQSRTAGTGTFVDIAGATSINHTVNAQNVSTEYRCVVTCTSSTTSSNSDTVAVNIITLDIDLGNDTSFCTGNILTLDAGDAGSGASYNWSNNATTQTTDVNTSGQYSVTVTAANGCIGTDTINITVIDAPTADAINAVAGANNSYSFNVVNANGSGSYIWNFGDNSPNSTETSPSHTYAQAGTYTVTVTISNACGEVTLTKTIEVESTSINTTTAAALGISLYPNPTAQTIFLQYSQAINVNKVTITNATGQVLFSQNEKVNTIDVNQFANGLYFINVYTEKGTAVLKVTVLK